MRIESNSEGARPLLRARERRHRVAIRLARRRRARLCCCASRRRTCCTVLSSPGVKQLSPAALAPQASVLKSNEHWRGLFKNPSPSVSHCFMHRVVDELRFRFRDRLIGMARELDAAIGAGRVHVHVPIRERARDDAVVVAGITLRGHHALPAARRATLVVRVVERLGVEHVDEPLRLHRHVVQRAIREVDDLLGVPQREHAGRAVGRPSARCRWRPSRSRAAALPACRRSPESRPPSRRCRRRGTCRSSSRSAATARR